MCSYWHPKVLEIGLSKLENTFSIGSHDWRALQSFKAHKKNKTVFLAIDGGGLSIFEVITPLTYVPQPMLKMAFLYVYT